MAQLQAVEIPAPHGMLEGLLRLPDADAPAPRMIALICHPHPVGGGTMHNKVVFRVAQALGTLGIPSLRFNFRGVGRSTGTYDAGRGEQDDVRAALDYLASRFSEFPDIPVCLAGFSFGSAVGLPVGCADPRVRQLIGVGVPVSLMGVNMLDGCAKHKLIVQGEHDEYGPLAEVREWFARIPEPKHLTIVPGADHFFTAYQTELLDAVIDYFQSGASVLGSL
ncbi:MAG TPA: alpha/beta family hydrolase [Ktedonobacterales bacterium]